MSAKYYIVIYLPLYNMQIILFPDPTTTQMEGSILYQTDNKTQLAYH